MMELIVSGAKFVMRSAGSSYNTNVRLSSVYTIERTDGIRVFWKDDCDQMRNTMMDVFKHDFLIIPDYRAGDIVRCISTAGGGSAFSDVTIGKTYTVTGIEGGCLLWIDDAGDTCSSYIRTTIRRFELVGRSPAPPAPPSTDTLPVDMVQALMKSSGFIINPAQAQVILDMACVYAKSIGETV